MIYAALLFHFLVSITSTTLDWYVPNKNIVIILVLVKGATETYLNDPEQQQKD